jgi:hypothetical protein
VESAEGCLGTELITEKLKVTDPVTRLPYCPNLERSPGGAGSTTGSIWTSTKPGISGSGFYNYDHRRAPSGLDGGRGFDG